MTAARGLCHVHQISKHAATEYGGEIKDGHDCGALSAGSKPTKRSLSLVCFIGTGMVGVELGPETVVVKSCHSAKAGTTVVQYRVSSPVVLFHHLGFLQDVSPYDQ
jgi:hypothetical protein